MEVYLGTGRRKNAIARVRMQPGDGKIEVNNKDLLGYFRRDINNGYRATTGIDRDVGEV